MDYIFFSSLKEDNAEFLIIVVSYDIACQWIRNFWNRMMKYPHEFHIDGTTVRVTFLVPKFHLPAHRLACHSSYSFNLTPCVGRTDGEAPERGWSSTNALSSSTKEMAPGSRRDTLDDHFGDMNWRKVCGLGLYIFFLGYTTITMTTGASLLRKIKAAVPERNDHLLEFRDLTENYRDSAIKWKEEVEAWERDRTNPNPFEYKGESKQISLYRHNHI
jgi:hypothetical protein